MDWSLYVVIFSVTVIIVIIECAAMRSAYKMGFALGQLNASLKHTELLTKQLAEKCQ